MARITVEDCLENLNNRFELVLQASRRARQLSNGAEPTVERNGEKPTVLALREIAAGLINKDMLDAADANARIKAQEAEAMEQVEEE